ncbi:beta-1,3-glucanase family protein [Tuwongella immobilis]|uniref:GH64 domain-containing protein n=1 Tax=Tuwongella immobilis TaxID=692036 RepID=A0A6C2YVA4_9BACT|nr:beta-1,3-glucanase family protein [Tuwongella immobilis]VIP04802.1 Hemolysin-type calcium-binding region domain protein OS=Rhodopirellula maiorica SM1 GN=RMSM_03614 PE=4 SV=1: FG-GAP: VCBS: FG-GAP [Tuwongella immobilis]VTS06964.1 Hemolysin-type calcium-binding region domain protein OS=Rhodopirellula maiorica SM1 GN=RMSM_03614 PE=4 SV=1: FG-GAP: VCBS: FG-GAP [Tuwongella immobilis]
MMSRPNSWFRRSWNRTGSSSHLRWRLSPLEHLEAREVMSDSPISFTFINETNLQNTPIFVAMYAKEPVQGSANWGAIAPSNAAAPLNGQTMVFTPFDASLNNTLLTNYELFPNGASSTTITLPNTPGSRLDSARIVISVGGQSKLTIINKDAGVSAPNLGNPDDPNAGIYYDFVEFTERDSDGTLFINTTQIDQVGFPLEVTSTPVDPNVPNGVGIQVSRQDLFNDFTNYINSMGAVDPAALGFLDCISPTVVGAGNIGNPTTFRILSPKDLVQIARTTENPPQAFTSSLTTYFDDAIKALFRSPPGGSLTLNVGNPYPSLNPNDPQTYVFNGTASTETIGAQTYNVLRFVGDANAGSLKDVAFTVYEPIFNIVRNITGSIDQGSTTLTVADASQLSVGMFVFGPGIIGDNQILAINGNTLTLQGASANPITNGAYTFSNAPSFVANKLESSGQMVFACDGVFADNVARFGAPNDAAPDTNSLYSQILANLENQLVSALNRGVSDLNPSQWQDPTNYYRPGSKSNFYSGFLHQGGVSIGNQAYGFPYDDQAGFSSTMAIDNPTAITIRLGAWTQSTALTSQYAVGAGDGSGLVRLLNADQTEALTVTPFGAFTGGVRTATADFNNDGVPDLVVGTGPGRATEVKVIDGKTQTELFTINPFEASFTGGVYVAAGDITGDGTPELIITPDEGGGPRVRVFDGTTFTQIADFLGIDDPNFRGGVRAAVGDLDGDGHGDLIVMAGFGGGPRVAIYSGISLAANGGPKLVEDFFVFEETLRNGAFVTSADVNGDGYAELVVGGGPGGGPRVSVFDGADLVLRNQQTRTADFFAGNADSRDGVRLTMKDLDGDDLADLVTGSGPGGATVNHFLDSSLDGNAVTPSDTFDAFADFTGGVFVG